MLKNVLVSFGAGLVLGAALWAYFRPVQEKIVTKTDTVEQVKIRTVVRTIVKPDGSKETVKVIDDNSVTTTRQNQAKTVSKKPQWILGVSAGSQLANLQPVYGLEASKRLLGPAFVGAYGRSDGEFGVALKLEF